jgi:hypothetical protein
MKCIVKLLLLSFLACLVSCAVDEGHAKKREIEAMLRKEGEYEYNLVGKRLLRPIDDALLKRLLEHPEENDQHDYVLHSWLLRIAAESDRKYLWILEQEKRRYSGDPERNWIANILLAYDYNVNGNQQAFEKLLAQIRTEAQSKNEDWNWKILELIHPLSAINEWDLCKATLISAPIETDGAGGDEVYAFWLQRRYFFPDNKEFPDSFDDFLRTIIWK